jgi:superfamily II DNA/RNA helicase
MDSICTLKLLNQQYDRLNILVCRIHQSSAALKAESIYCNFERKKLQIQVATNDLWIGLSMASIACVLKSKGIKLRSRRLISSVWVYSAENSGWPWNDIALAL